MTDRVDHVAEAQEWLSNTADEYAREPHVHTNVVGYLASAQVHATLALVEQQRIANRLKVAEIDQLTSMAQTMPMPGCPVDPAIAIRQYLTEEDWEQIEVRHD